MLTRNCSRAAAPARRQAATRSPNWRLVAFAAAVPAVMRSRTPGAAIFSRVNLPCRARASGVHCERARSRARSRCSAVHAIDLGRCSAILASLCALPILDLVKEKIAPPVYQHRPRELQFGIGEPAVKRAVGDVEALPHHPCRKAFAGCVFARHLKAPYWRETEGY